VKVPSQDAYARLRRPVDMKTKIGSPLRLTIELEVPPAHRILPSTGPTRLGNDARTWIRGPFVDPHLDILDRIIGLRVM
jgi:hypothetical protein